MPVNQGSYAMRDTVLPRRIVWAFRGEYQFLSNFWECQVTLPAEDNLPALEFNSTEKAYMAWKTLDLATRLTIYQSTPGQAKKLTHTPDFPLRPDYSDSGRLSTMLNLNRQKYSPRNPQLRTKLLATRDIVLIEGNDWGDTFFGFSFHDGWGHNHLGRILMQIRREIQSEKQ